MELAISGAFALMKPVVLLEMIAKNTVALPYLEMLKKLTLNRGIKCNNYGSF